MRQKTIFTLFTALFALSLQGSYVTKASGGSPEGTSVKSTGEVAGLSLTSNGSNGASWTVPAGGGDVVGGSSSTDNGFCRYDGTSGKTIQNTGTGSTLNDAGTATFAQLIDSGLTASTVPYANASKQLTSSAVTPTELGYLSGVTSALQTQLTAKAPAASPTFTGTVTLPLTASRVVVTGASSEAAVSSVTPTQLALLVPSEYDAGNSGTAKTLDWTNGNAQKLTLTGNVTLTLSNPVTGTPYVLKIATGAGSFTVTWPAAVKWPGGTPPTITATASKVDLVNLYWDGTNYYGSFAQNY